MSANTLLTSIITGGTNSHTTVAEEANALATDFVSNGVVGAITLNTGSGGTGSFCVNADASTVVNAASTTNNLLVFRGLLRMNAAGTITPQISFSGTAAGTPTMLANSYITFTPLGTNTNNVQGNVG